MLQGLGRLVGAGMIGAALVASAHGAWAQEEREFVAPRPDWVDLIEAPEARPERMGAVDEGVYYLAIDAQIRREGEETWYYRRSVKQITSRAGLESGAALNYSYDPEISQFAVHGVRIVRDGETLDRLPDLSFQTARQEPGLGYGIIDGEITVFAEISDVRVGDIVDLEVSWRDTDALWPNGFTTSAGFGWTVPVGVSRLRVLTPRDLEIATRAHGVDIEPDVRRRGDEVEQVWAVYDADPIKGEDDTPAEHPTWGFVETSTMQSWSEVVDWAVGVFDIDRTLPPSVAEEVADIAAETGDPYLRATRALRYVQDNIRYVGDEVGLGSHVPRTPAEVAARGWGDCKDVSLLLATMLETLGIEAYPALTDIDMGAGLPDALPSPYAFDHAITLVVLDGEDYWLDATRTHQGGVLPAIAQPEYAYALPVRASQEDLAPIDLREPKGPQIDTEELFDLHEGDGVTLEVRTRYIGREADYFRYRLDSEGRDSVLELFFEYYQGLYPGVERNGDATVEDSLDGNVIDLVERYQLSAERYVADDLNLSFPLRGDGVLGLVPQWSASVRETPMALPYPMSRRHVIQLDNAPSSLIASDPIEIKDKHLRYSSSQRELPRGLRLEFYLETLAPQASPANAARVSELSRDIEENSDLIINLE